MTDPPDDRSPLAEAAAWASRVTTIALGMLIPGAIGLWIDQLLGTVMVFLMLGLVLGVTTGIMHLVRLTRSDDRHGPPDGKSSDKRVS